MEKELLAQNEILCLSQFLLLPNQGGCGYDSDSCRIFA